MPAPQHQFTDSKGRTWSVTVNVGALKRCIDLAGIDLADTVEGDLFDRLALDPILLCNTLAAVCRPDMERQKVTDEDFAEGLAGDVIDLAAAALVDAIVYFFRLRHGGIVAKIATKKKEVEALALKAVDRFIDSGEIEKKVQQHLAEQLGPQFGDAPASLV
ncbi:MAG: hypothetical protein NTW96_00340 [Planctomycetia bacterium]|nr:hypothetical protein [Planctomycetia bacterium]